MKHTNIHNKVLELSHNAGLFPFISRKIDSRKPKTLNGNRCKLYYTFQEPVAFPFLQKELKELLWQIKSLNKDISEVSINKKNHNDIVVSVKLKKKLPKSLRVNSSGKLTKLPQLFTNDLTITTLLPGHDFEFQDLKFSCVGTKCKVVSISSSHLRVQSLEDPSKVCGIPTKFFENKTLHSI